ncbi:MAG: pitrilysin family protein [candidate division WWE3 bacterium]|nr:pitrilysin family protein [candidate division WWE3 bacterium]
MFTLKDFSVTRHEAKLTNGTRVVLFERPGTPVAISAAFIAGSRFDPPGKEGLAHFLEHMLLAGTKNFPTKDKLAAYIEDLGGITSASTGHLALRVEVAVGDPIDVPSAIKVLSEEIINPLFNEKAIETERGAILRELASSKESPTKVLSRLAYRLIYQKTVEDHDTLGSEESIKSITKDDILNFYKEHLNASSLAIVVSGGVDLAKLTEILEKELPVASGSRPEFSANLPIFREKITDFSYFKGSNLNVEFDFRTVHHTHPDSRSLSILGSILGGGRTSALAKKLRYEKGLVYGVSARNGGFIDGGDFGISTHASKDNLQEVMDIIVTELKRMKDTGPTAEELQLVKNRLIKSKKMSMQTSGSWVDWHEYRTLYYPDSVWTIEDYFKEVSSVTSEEVREVASKYLTNNNWYLTITGDVDEAFLQSIKISL